MRARVLLLIVGSVAFLGPGPWFVGAAEVEATDPVEELDAREVLHSGILALAAGDLQRADLLLTASMRAGRASGHRGLLFGGLTHLAGVRVEQGRFGAGLALMIEAIPVADALAADGAGAPIDLGVTVRLQIVALLRSRDALPDAEAMGWEALAVAVETGGVDSALSVVQILLQTAVEQGAEGEDLTLRAVEMDELLAGLGGYSQASGGLAGAAAIAALMVRAGRGLSQERALQDAEPYFDAGLSLDVALGRREEAFATCRDLAWLALQQDDRARSFLHLAGCGRGATANVAEFAVRRGELTIGSALSLEGAAGATAYERAVLVARAGRQAGAVGRFGEAAGRHELAALDFERAGRAAEAVAERVERGVALLRAGKSAEAGTVLDAALAAAMPGGRPLHPEARIRGLLARSALRASRGSWEAAREDVAAAGEALFALRRTLPLAATATELAWLRWGSGDVEGGREGFEKAVDFETELGLIEEGRRGLEGLATARAAAGDGEAAVAAWRSSLGRADRWTRGRLVPDVLRGRALGEPLPHPLFGPVGFAGVRRAVGVLVDAGRIEEAFVLSERIRALVWRAILEEDPDPRTDRPVSPDEEALVRVREQIDALRDRSRSLAYGGGADTEGERREILNHLTVYEAREADLVESMPAGRARTLAAASIDMDVLRDRLADRVLLSAFDVGDRFVVFRLDRGELTATATVGDETELARAVGDASAPGPRSARARRELGSLLTDDAAAIRDRRVVLVLDGVLHHARLDLLSVPAGRRPLEDWIRGLAVLPAAALIAQPAPAAELVSSTPGPTSACTVRDRRPLAAYLSGVATSALAEAEAADPAQLLRGSPAPPELVDFADARLVLPDLLHCSVVDPWTQDGRPEVDVGPGRAAEALPLEPLRGAAWVALGEIAAHAPRGVLATNVRLDEAAQATVREAFDAALATGEPPDVAVLAAVRALRRSRRVSARGGLRWLAPAGGTISP